VFVLVSFSQRGILDILKYPLFYFEKQRFSVYDMKEELGSIEALFVTKWRGITLRRKCLYRKTKIDSNEFGVQSSE